MSGTGFTPGPWDMRPSDEYRGDWEINTPSPDSVSGSGEPWFVALVHDGAAGVPAEANARLIAAAPELYGALEHLVHVAEKIDFGPDASLDRSIGEAIIALAKARGEQ